MESDRIGSQRSAIGTAADRSDDEPLRDDRARTRRPRDAIRRCRSRAERSNGWEPIRSLESRRSSKSKESFVADANPHACKVPLGRSRRRIRE